MNKIGIPIIILLLSSCQTRSSSSEIDRSQFALLICQCSEILVTYNQELTNLSASDNIGALAQKMEDGDRIINTAEKCITDQLSQSVHDILDNSFAKEVELKCQRDPRMIQDLMDRILKWNQVTFKK